MTEYFALSPRPNAKMISDMVAQAIDDQPVLPIPAYMVDDLPSAVTHPNSTVKIMDDPQGTASSNGAVWISDVDGSNLGAGGNG